ncbi:MAG TPA: hypothetical protein PLH25_05330 [Flavobacterium sp.]|nr:hypothetical protein [Flavobacterium sp.]HQW69069.1 hypothetical protein [Flavobacterium sp.]
MKKIFLSLTIATLLFSCKEETREKVKEASKAVGSEVKENYKKAKVKAAKVIDTTKVKEKVNVAIKKSAEKIEEGARKVKENAGK